LPKITKGVEDEKILIALNLSHDSNCVSCVS